MKRKLSFTTMGTPGMPCEQIIQLALECGFDGVDIRCSAHKGEVQPDTLEAALKRLAEDFTRAGLVIPDVLCYPQVPKDAEKPWEIYESEVRRDLKIGRLLGAHSIRIFTIKPTDLLKIDEILERSAEAVRRILAGDSSPVQIIIQNHHGHCDALQSVQLAKKVGNPRFGLVYSPDHTILCRESPWQYVLEQVLPWTREVYIADMKEIDGKHRSVLPGQGEVPLRRVVEFFDAHGFQGFYTFKWELLWNKNLEGPEIAMPHFMEYMRSV